MNGSYTLTIDIDGGNKCFSFEDGSVNTKEWTDLLSTLANALGKGDPFYEAQKNGMFVIKKKIMDSDGNTCGWYTLNYIPYTTE
jgi:hypothetical protein